MPLVTLNLPGPQAPGVHKGHSSPRPPETLKSPEPTLKQNWRSPRSGSPRSTGSHKTPSPPVPGPFGLLGPHGIFRDLKRSWGTKFPRSLEILVVPGCAKSPKLLARLDSLSPSSPTSSRALSFLCRFHGYMQDASTIIPIVCNSPDCARIC
jgi:hypothetical protein